jgi:chromate transporter
VSQEDNPETQPLTKVSFPRFVGYFLWLGTVGFGGPIALAGHMQQDLVDERGWISKETTLKD